MQRNELAYIARLNVWAVGSSKMGDIKIPLNYIAYSHGLDLTRPDQFKQAQKELIHAVKNN